VAAYVIVNTTNNGSNYTTSRDATACREVGVSRSAAQRWKNGARVRRPDGTVTFVPPLEPLAVRQISPRFLPEEERVRIADLASHGLGPTAFGRELGRSASTISWELRRNLHPTGQYRPFHAHSAAAVLRRRERPTKIMEKTALFEFVVDKLKLRWSPQQISRALRRKFLQDRSRAFIKRSTATRPGSCAG
jgi:IS30 family transposase